MVPGSLGVPGYGPLVAWEYQVMGPGFNSWQILAFSSIPPHALKSTMVCLFVDDIDFRLSFLPIYRLFEDTHTRQQEVYDRSAHTCCSRSRTQTMWFSC